MRSCLRNPTLMQRSPDCGIKGVTRLASYRPGETHGLGGHNINHLWQFIDTLAGVLYPDHFLIVARGTFPESCAQKSRPRLYATRFLNRSSFQFVTKIWSHRWPHRSSSAKADQVKLIFCHRCVFAWRIVKIGRLAQSVMPVVIGSRIGSIF